MKEIITPSVESLLEVTTNVCQVTGCEKVLRNSSVLRFHMAKAHGEGALTKKHGNVLYACPAKHCVRNAADPRKDFFPSMYRLRKVCII